MSLLGLSNFLFFQWFFVRLARVHEDGGDGRLGRFLGWTFLTGVVPLTGWWSPYRYAWGCTFCDDRRRK